MTSMQHPYTALTPDKVMDALARQGLWPDGRLLALNSYENRVYRAHLDEPVQGHGAVVAKFYRPGRWSREQILEEHAFAAELVAAEVPAVAPLHNTGAARPFAHRPALNVAQFAQEPAEWLLGHGAIPLEVESEWRAALDAALPLLQDTLEGMSERAIRVHGDCHPGNILWTPDTGPHFVDLDDARMAPAVQDLWMLLSGERRQRTLQLSALLEGYEQLRDFDRRELGWIEGLRTLRLIP